MAMADRSLGLLWKLPYLCITEVQAQTGHAASSARLYVCANNAIADEWQWQTGHAAFPAQKRNALYMLITELQANGNGKWVMRPPPQSELRKPNTLYVLITELQNGNGRQVTRPPPHCGSRTPYVCRTAVLVNGNGGHVTRPPPQSELRKRNTVCGVMTEWQWQTCRSASSENWVAQAERHICIHNGSAGADRSHGLLSKVSCKRNALCVVITANGNGKQVMRPPPQSELQKRNALCVLITELQANGNGRQVTWPPSQSELRKRNATCVFTTEAAANGKGRKQGCDGGRISRAPLRLSF